MTEPSPYQLISPVSAGESDDLLAGKNKEDGLRRIQALLADWLRMENLVVLSAAGCSVGAGGRLMTGPRDNNLECLVLDAVENCSLTDEAKGIVKWKKANNFGAGDFEEWLGYLFNASSLSSSDKSPIQSILWKENISLNVESEKQLRRFIEKAIFAECALELGPIDIQGSFLRLARNQWAADFFDSERIDGRATL